MAISFGLCLSVINSVLLNQFFDNVTWLLSASAAETNFISVAIALYNKIIDHHEDWITFWEKSSDLDAKIMVEGLTAAHNIILKWYQKTDGSTYVWAMSKCVSKSVE